MSSAETRLIGVIAIGSIIIGLLPAVQSDVNIIAWSYWPNYFLYLALATYLFAVFKVYQGLKGQKYYAVASFDPKELRELYWHIDDIEFKTAIYEDLEGALESNRRNLDRKNRSFLWVVPTVGSEILFLLVWTFIRAAVPIS